MRSTPCTSLKRRKSWLFEAGSLFLIGCCVIFSSGCGEESPASGAGVPDDADANGVHKIITTTSMVGDIVRQVVGSHAEVVNLMGEGVDPHLYKPTRSDVASIADADVVFYSGLLLEGRMTDVFIKAAMNGQSVHAVTELISESYLLDPPEFSGHWDPHVWMDVSAWSQCVDAVSNIMCELDPEHADDFRSNTAIYQAKLQALDDYTKKAIASIPDHSRILVTAHDAFNYFGRAYAIDVMGIQGISTESEAGISDINHLKDILVDRRVPAVFVESSVSDNNVRALIEGAGSLDHAVTIGGRLFSDAAGPAGDYTGTYIGMIDHNVTTIARALGGDVPDGGLNGQLSSNGEEH